MNTTQFPEIAKAVGGQRGGKYLKRVPKPGGGYRYIYKEAKRESQDMVKMEGQREQLMRMIEVGERERDNMRGVLNRLATREVKVYDKMLTTKDPEEKKRLDQKSDKMAGEIGRIEGKIGRLDKKIESWGRREVKLMDRVMAIKKRRI